MSRLVVVSNRVGPVKDAARAGGLAVALVEALSAAGGLWYGWSGETSEDNDGRLRMTQDGDVTLATLDLTDHGYEQYYNGFANRTLWPLFHYRLDLTSFDRSYYETYQQVNAQFAEGLVPLLQPDDLIWVHDYHFLAFGQELRRLNCDQTIGFFLHIPFPAREVFITLPRHDKLVEALFAYDVLGFQTDRDRRMFQDYVVRELGGEVWENKARAFGRTIEVRTFPIGIDTQTFVDSSSSPEAINQYTSMREMLKGRHQIIGVDRLDYTKGLPERFHSFERLLEDYPDIHRKVSFMQIAPVSRSSVEEYVDIRQELEGASGRINGRFAEFDWTPLRYLNRSFTRHQLAGLYRASRIGLVTPLRDGMNLVAKEYVAAQDPDDPGVLVLSRFAGAATQLRSALIVNPYDVKAVADAMNEALHMTLQERRDRHQSMMPDLLANNVNVWRDNFIDAMNAVERREAA